MKYQEYIKLAPGAQNVYLYDRVEMMVRSMSEMRETFDGQPIEFERELDNEGRTVRLVVKCPYQTVAWLVGLVVENSSILSIRIDGSTVFVW